MQIDYFHASKEPRNSMYLTITVFFSETNSKQVDNYFHRIGHLCTTVSHLGKTSAARGAAQLWCKTLSMQDTVRVKKSCCKLFANVLHPSTCTAQILQADVFLQPGHISSWGWRCPQMCPEHWLKGEKSTVFSSKHKFEAKYKSQ